MSSESVKKVLEDCLVALEQGPPSFRDMPLRDWFAGMALMGMLAAPMGKFEHQVTLDIISRDAYISADLMLREREKPHA